MIEIIKELCKDQGVSVASLERELGFGRGSVYRWDSISPSVDKVEKVANYLNVSIDYLTGNTPFKNRTEEKHSIIVAVMKYIRKNKSISVPRFFHITIPEEMYTKDGFEDRVIYSESLLGRYDNPQVPLTDLEYLEVYHVAISLMKYDSDYSGNVFLRNNEDADISIPIPFFDIPKITLDTSKSQLFRLDAKENNFTEFHGELSYTGIKKRETKKLTNSELPKELQELGIKYIEVVKEMKASDLDIESLKKAIKVAKMFAEEKGKDEGSSK